MSNHALSGLRLVATTTAIAALMAISAGPVAADTTPPGDATYSQAGSTAELYASSCTDNGDDTVSCVEQQVGIFSGKMTDNVSGVTHTSQVCAALGSYTYSLITEDYVGTPVFERGCRVDLPSGAIRFDSKLNWAVLAATSVTVEQLICDEEKECVPSSARDVVVAATWTGFGPLRTSKGHSSANDGTCRYADSFKGSDRSADVIATVDGLAIDGDDRGGYLASGRYSFRSRCSEA